MSQLPAMKSFILLSRGHNDPGGLEPEEQAHHVLLSIARPPGSRMRACRGASQAPLSRSDPVAISGHFTAHFCHIM